MKNPDSTANDPGSTRPQPKPPTLEEVADDVLGVEVDVSSLASRVGDVEDEQMALADRLTAAETMIRRLVRAVRAGRKAAPRG